MKYPEFYLGNNVLSIVDKIKYLGHIISAELSDDEDIYRQCRMLYAQANTLLRKFGYCSEDVKLSL